MVTTTISFGGLFDTSRPGQRSLLMTLPTLGRIVHVHVAVGVWRPAIVMGADGDGSLLVHAFLHETDPQGRLQNGVGHVTYGTNLGQWVWPTQEKKTEFLAEIPASPAD